MTNEIERSEPQATERIVISCPGCGRKDRVSWPVDQDVYHWKCFNCGKEFDLARGDHH
jgi:Zn ribbon nucleic-acid-binding protein